MNLFKTYSKKYFSNGYMVYMIIHSGSHEVVKIMGHDVKQFKSLEGFLESGPQFVLQAYIILLGQKKGIDDFTRVEASKTMLARNVKFHLNCNFT